MPIELTNRNLWLLVAVMLAVYLILVLEDIAAGLKRNRYIVIEALEGGRTLEHMRNVTPVKETV